MPDVPVDEVNALTARWAAGRPDQGTVFSGARAVLDLLATSPGTRGALGLWAREDLPPRPEWRAGLPGATLGALSGDAAAD